MTLTYCYKITYTFIINSGSLTTNSSIVLIRESFLDRGKNMAPKASKKDWSKPQLIIIGEGTPEENVLVAGCKSNHSKATIKPTTSHSNCNELGENCRSCKPNSGGAS